MRQLIVFTIFLFTAANAFAQCSVSIGINNAPWCNECGGVAWAQVTGGTPPLNMVWSNGSTGAIAEGVCIGDISVEVEDSDGCFATASATVGVEGSPIEIQLSTSLPDPNSPHFCVDFEVQGGCPPFMYSWFPDDPNEPWVCTASPNTTYTLTITDACGCQSSDSITTGDSQVNLEPIEIIDVSLYPNPNNGEQLFISGLGDAPSQIEFISLTDQKVLQVNNTDSSHFIDISNLDSGFYVCRIMYGNQVIVRNFVKL